MMKIAPIFLLACVSAFVSCTSKNGETTSSEQQLQNSTSTEQQMTDTVPIKRDVVIEKELLFDKHTLTDSYPYKDTTRQFQWDKIQQKLELIESINSENTSWGILHNYKNKNGEAPLIRNYRRDAYKRLADTLGIERFQSVPLYFLGDSSVPL